MKHFKLLLAACVLLIGGVYAMDPTAKTVKAHVKAYFIPEDQEVINQELILMIDTATKQVLIAMYWITDDFIINKLIELKKRGVDVQIIFDESSGSSIQVMDKFLANNILPVISLKEIDGIMHNKFFGS